jgi:integrase
MGHPVDPVEALAVLQRALQPQASPTFRELWKRWADVQRAHLADFKTEEGRASHLLAFLGDRQVGSLTVFDVDGERGYRAQRLVKLRGGKPLKPGTRNREVDLLNRVLNWAVREDLITRNPVAHVKPEPEDNIQHTKIETEEKLAALVAEAHPLVEALILCWFETGARRSEIMSLRWDQLEGNRVLFPRTKNREPRRARLAPRALAALLALPRFLDCPWIFVNPKTKRPYNPRHLARLFDQAVVSSGLEGVNGEKITPHKLRHGFAYRARRFLRLQEKQVMRMLGHKTAAAFKRYGITDEAEAEEGWDAVADASRLQETVDRKPPQRAQSSLPTDEDSAAASRA